MIYKRADLKVGPYVETRVCSGYIKVFWAKPSLVVQHAALLKVLVNNRNNAATSGSVSVGIIAFRLRVLFACLEIPADVEGEDWWGFDGVEVGEPGKVEAQGD